MKDIIVRHSYISIPDYKLRDCTILENVLSEWNERRYQREFYGLTYNEETCELRVPIGVGIETVARWLNRNIVYKYEPDPYRNIQFHLTVQPRDRIQSQIIQYVINHSKRYSQVAIVAGTGVGKTYCAIASSYRIGQMTMVVSHSAKLRSHWMTKIQEYTDLHMGEILLIDSTKKLYRILEEGSHSDYQFFSISHQIIARIAHNSGWDEIGRIFRLLGIGTVIIDEVHRRFSNTVQILTHTNSKNYILLTATFIQTGSKRNKVFQTVFANIPKFYQKDLMNVRERMQKHIDGYIITYNTKPTMEDQFSVENGGGLNVARYCSWLVDKDPHFKDIFTFYLDQCIRGTRSFMGKGLVLCGSIHACDILTLYIQEKWGDEIIVGTYHSKMGMKQTRKDLMIENSDLIITTSGSLGEGTDIDNLHYIIDIETYISEIANIQHPGRMRNLGDEHKYNYIKILNIGFRKVNRQLRNALPIYRQNLGTLHMREWKDR